MSMIVLNDLPREHQLRNAPLIDIGAESRFVRGKTWRKVEQSWKIAKKSFNDLGPAWTASSVWRATVAP